MIRRPPRSTQAKTLFPYTTLFRSHIFNILQCPQFAFSSSSSFLLPSGTWDLILVKVKCSFSGCPSGHPPLQSRPSCRPALRQRNPRLAGRGLGALCLGRSRSAHCHAEAWLANAGLSGLQKAQSCTRPEWFLLQPPPLRQGTQGSGSSLCNQARTRLKSIPQFSTKERERLVGSLPVCI